ncbi:Phage minor structural protein GP20 [compost metagenome]
MEWLKELLKKLGVEESKIDGAVSEANKEIPKHFVPKTQYNELSEAKKKLEGDLTDRDKQLETLSKTAGASEEMQKEIARLRGENKTAKEQYDADMKELKINSALKLALAGDTHDPDLVAGLLDKSKIEINEDGTIKAGFDDQVKALRDSKGFLFAEKDGGKPKFKGATPADGNPNNPPSEKKPSEMNYTELCAYMEANPGAEI